MNTYICATIKQVIVQSISRNLSVSANRCSRTWPRPSISDVSGREEAVVFTDDERTIVCWHPEPSHPYHLSKPIPIETVQNTPLNVQYDTDMRKIFARDDYENSVRELMKMTTTSKYSWRFQPSRRKRLPKIGREYL